MHFNKKALLEYLSGDKEIYHELVGRTLKQIPEFIFKMKQYIDENDFENAQSRAHAIKGSSLLMHFELLKLIAIEFENLPSFDCEKVNLLYDEIVKEWEKIKPELEKEV